MKSVRKGVFETNSSSSHSLTINKNTTGVYDFYLPLDKAGYYEPNFGANYNFSCEPCSYNRLVEKLEYLITLSFILYRDNVGYNGITNVVKRKSDIGKIPDIKKIENMLKKSIRGFKGFKIYTKYFYMDSDNISDWLCKDGGIDHQSTDDFVDLNSWLRYYHITIENFLFNPQVILNIGNDWS